MFDSLRTRLADRIVATLGESMGGSGALLATNYLNVSRTLAISPQFAVKPPFALFDETITQRDISHLTEHYIDDFGKVKNIETCHLLFGNHDWQDTIHQTMFEARGFSIVNVDSGHGVSYLLKQKNKLSPLLSQFVDLQKSFQRSNIIDLLVGLATEIKLAQHRQRLLPLQAENHPIVLRDFPQSQSRPYDGGSAGSRPSFVIAQPLDRP